MRVDARRIIVRRTAEQEALVGRAERFAAALGPDLDVRAVVVFGSVARGDFNVWSDVDVLVIVPQVDVRLLDLVRSAANEQGLVQPVMWTASHLTDQLRRRDPIAVESVERGIWLRGSPAIWLR